MLIYILDCKGPRNQILRDKCQEQHQHWDCLYRSSYWYFT